ncbi:MAG: hypothetical protein QOE45_1182 [Frankiaceae bacterium]|jgi:hypothetical protein|nr:hypothetical protein [Frankiaceae bacterium]
MRRRLHLHKETLTELTTAELNGVVGASGNSCQNVCNSRVQDCITGLPCLRTLPRDCLTGVTAETVTC